MIIKISNCYILVLVPLKNQYPTELIYIFKMKSLISDTCHSCNKRRCENICKLYSIVLLSTIFVS